MDIAVTEQIVMNPCTLTLDQISKEQNEECKNIMLKRLLSTTVKEHESSA